LGEAGREKCCATSPEDVKKRYYDPTVHGLDFDAQVREADEKLRRATSLTEAHRIIAGAPGGLNDSGTLTTFSADPKTELSALL